MSRPRILYMVNDFLQHSQTYLECEIRSIRPDYNVQVFSMNRPDVPIETSIPTTYASKNWIKDVIRILDEFKPELIHGHYTYMVDVIYKAALIAGIPFTIRAHSFDVKQTINSEYHSARRARMYNSRNCLGLFVFPYARPWFEQIGIHSNKLIDSFPIFDFDRFFDPGKNKNGILAAGACLPKKAIPEYLKLASTLPGKNFSYHGIGYLIDEIIELNKKMGGPVQVHKDTPYKHMPTIYKSHNWLVYPADSAFDTAGWPLSFAEAQASGLGLCVKNTLPNIREFIGEESFTFDTIDEARAIISQPVTEHAREAGFELARRSDVKKHREILGNVWEEGLRSCEPLNSSLLTRLLPGDRTVDGATYKLRRLLQRLRP